jgi:cell division FtsZ-interacting protein ZapD
MSLANEEELQDFYNSLGHSTEVIKFVVQDLTAPDGECTFLFISHWPVVISSRRMSRITYLLSSLPCLAFLVIFITCCLVALPGFYSSLHNQPQPQSLQLGQWIQICPIFPRAVSNQR